VDYTSAISQNVVVSYSSATNSIDFVLTAESVTAVEDNAVTVSGYELSQNYPNPFNPTTKISYQIPVSGNVTLKVYNTLGKEVAKLASGFMNAGSYSIVFNASNLSSGVYFYKLEAGSFSAIKKLVLLK
jgi:hypothetical protein